MQTLGFASSFPSAFLLHFCLPFFCFFLCFYLLLSFSFFMLNFGGFGGLRTSRPLLASFCTTGSVDVFPISQRHQRRKTRKSRTRRRSRRSRKQRRSTRLPHQPQRRHQGFPQHKPWLRFPVRTSLMRRQVVHHTSSCCMSSYISNSYLAWTVATLVLLYCVYPIDSGVFLVAVLIIRTVYFSVHRWHFSFSFLMFNFIVVVYCFYSCLVSLFLCCFCVCVFFCFVVLFVFSAYCVCVFCLLCLFFCFLCVCVILLGVCCFLRLYPVMWGVSKKTLNSQFDAK